MPHYNELGRNQLCLCPERLPLAKLLNHSSAWGGKVHQLWIDAGKAVVQRRGIALVGFGRVAMILLGSQGGAGELISLHLDAEDLCFSYCKLHLQLRYLVLQIRDGSHAPVNWVFYPRVCLEHQAAHCICSVMNWKLLQLRCATVLGEKYTKLFFTHYPIVRIPFLSRINMFACAIESTQTCNILLALLAPKTLWTIANFWGSSGGK